jgi:hypothetical protein
MGGKPLSVDSGYRIWGISDRIRVFNSLWVGSTILKERPVKTILAIFIFFLRSRLNNRRCSR